MPKKNSGARKKLEKEKASQPKPEKPVIDKTFGLKNKNKSKKVQAYVAEVKKQQSQKSKAELAKEKEKTEKKAKKEAQAELDRQMGELFKVAVDIPKVDKNVDPKSILCPHYKAGNCKYGKKCKHSHDAAVERKTAKINLYVDPREQEKDTMDTWDQDKLEQVLQQKERGREQQNSNATKIVCKYFLDALEKYQYGWLWKCPNGVNCHYRHALPPGFVLKRDQVKEEVKEVILEEEIEEERAKLDLTDCTPVTLELFLAWKKKKKEDKARKAKEAVTEAKKKAKKGGHGNLSFTGRQLFAYDPSVFQDDAAAGGKEDYAFEEEEEEQQASLQKGKVWEAVKHEDTDEDDEEGEEGTGESGAEPTTDGQKKKQEEAVSSSAAAGAIDESLFLDDDDIPE